LAARGRQLFHTRMMSSVRRPHRARAHHPRTQSEKKIRQKFRISYGASRSIPIRLSQSVEWRKYSIQGQVPICFDMYTLYMCEIHHNEFSFHEVRFKLPAPIACVPPASPRPWPYPQRRKQKRLFKFLECPWTITWSFYSNLKREIQVAHEYAAVPEPLDEKGDERC
jgi:hypothetical protein